MKPKHIVILALLLFTALVVVPLFMDWIIVGNRFPSNISNSEWVGFFGSYFGGLIGGIISLVGIAFTIKFTQEQNRKDREIQARPFFDIIMKHTTNSVHTNKWLGYVNLLIEKENDIDLYQAGSLLLNFKNIGNGSATNLNFEVLANNIADEHSGYFSNNNWNVTTKSLRPGEDADLSIDIIFNYIMPDLGCQTVTDSEGLEHRFAKIDLDAFPKSADFSLFFKYDDILGNHFQQTIEMTAAFYMDDKTRRFSCDIHVKRIDSPKELGQ